MKTIIENRVRNTNGTRMREREGMKGLEFKLSGVTQNIRRGRCSAVFPCIFLNPARDPLSPFKSH